MRFQGDILKMRATTIVIGFLFCGMANADLDYSVDAGARSYPLSGILEGDLGYGQILWGTAGGSPMYGYVRPHVGAGTAGTYNSAIATLDVYPISFLGVQAGGEAIENDKDYKAYDCTAYQCRGRFYRTFVQAELTLGAGPFFGQVRWKRERWTLANPGTGEFIESTSGLSLSSRGDSQTVYRAVAGYKLNPTWSFAGVYVYSQSDSTREVAHFPFAVVRYTSGPFVFGIGAGVYSSTIKPEGGSALLFINWNIKPSLALK